MNKPFLPFVQNDASLHSIKQRIGTLPLPEDDKFVLLYILADIGIDAAQSRIKEANSTNLNTHYLTLLQTQREDEVAIKETYKALKYLDTLMVDSDWEVYIKTNESKDILIAYLKSKLGEVETHLSNLKYITGDVKIRNIFCDSGTPVEFSSYLEMRTFLFYKGYINAGEIPHVKAVRVKGV